jgi:hypothetical protein
MAAAALRHDVRIIVPQRVVSMKYFMAFRAGNFLVPFTVISEPVVMRRVAAGTFLQGEGLHLDIIYAAFNSFCCCRLTENKNTESEYCQNTSS